jgi:DNA repair protein RecN (Recombination protein N)
MLRALAIRDLAIISSLEVEFGPGLSVLTGETGAGKSIIIGALSAVLGGRAGADVVRSGASRAVVDALFDLSASPEARLLVEEMGYDTPDGELALTREIADSGKSTARISGRPATVGQLRQIGEWLVDIHGQHEHQSLLDPRKHMAFLDAWAGPEHENLLRRTAEAWTQLKALEAELRQTDTDARERLRSMDLCRFQIQEIRSAAPEPGEDERLSDELRRLRNVERLRDSVRATLASLLESGHAPLADLLALAGREIESAAALDDSLAPVAETLTSVRYEVEEAARTLTDYIDSLDADPARLDAVQERLAALSDLKRKYGSSIDEVLAYADEAEARLSALEHSEENAERLTAEVAAARQDYEAQAALLTTSRAEAASRFERAVSSELSQLAMERAEFGVALSSAPPSSTGCDAVEFLISANPGEPVRPLARIASGGEISRVMLAIKSATASRSPLPTMVFDEVDVGIGGRTAGVIGQKMRTLAATAQVICITHLAQIAVCADRQYSITKVEEGGRTVVRVDALDEPSRIEELARMLSGPEVTEAAREHIRQMLARHRG